MKETKKAIEEIIDKVENRRQAILKQSGKSRDEVARAIYALSNEICELQKLLALALL